MTSLNAGVIGVRFVISLFVQRLIAQYLGETGVSKIGQLRNLSELLTSFSSLGIFNGVVKYVAEHRENKEQLRKLFSTVFVLSVFGIVSTAVVLFVFSESISAYLFTTTDFSYLIKLTAVIVPFISFNRIFNGVVNGLSQYKKFAKIELLGYVATAALTVVFLFNFNIDGVLIAIAITPVIQLATLLFVFFRVLKDYVEFKNLNWKAPMLKMLLSFSIMSFFSTVLLNYVSIEIRAMIIKKITETDAGIWTAMTNISKNYMVFSSALFTLYVLPKYAAIHSKNDFIKELMVIFKTLLPLFGVGMLLIYFLRDYVIQIVYPGFDEMAPLFKWQLAADFLRLITIILGYQFIAKKLVLNFIFTEVISLIIYFGLASYFVDIYGVEGVVIANFIRYIIVIFIVFFLVYRYFQKTKNRKEELEQIE